MLANTNDAYVMGRMVDTWPETAPHHDQADQGVALAIVRGQQGAGAKSIAPVIKDIIQQTYGNPTRGISPR